MTKNYEKFNAKVSDLIFTFKKREEKFNEDWSYNTRYEGDNEIALLESERENYQITYNHKKDRLITQEL